MDKLITPAPVFYNGAGTYAKLKDKVQDPGGELLQRSACRAKAIKEAKQHSSMRRTHSDAYIYRCDDGKTMTLSDFDQLGARWVKDCNDVSSRIDHNGWYTDSFEGETLIGVVLCFTRGGSSGMEGNDNLNETKPKGRVIYMAGTRHSDWDGVTLDLDTTDDPITAARWADSMAERAAEEYREEDEKFQAEQKAEECREEIAAARKKCLALLRDMRPIRKGLIGAPESICTALRERVQEYREDIANWRNELGELA